MRKLATLLACLGLTAAAGCTDQTTDETEAPVTGKTAEPGALGTDTEGTTTPERDTDTWMPEEEMDTTAPDRDTQQLQDGMEDPSAMTTPPQAGTTGAPGSEDPKARLSIVEIEIERLSDKVPQSEVSKLERQHQQAEQRLRTAEKAVEDLETAVDRAESKSDQQGTQPQGTQPQTQPEPGMQGEPAPGMEGAEPGMEGTQPQTQPQPGQQGTY